MRPIRANSTLMAALALPVVLTLLAAAPAGAAVAPMVALPDSAPRALPARAVEATPATTPIEFDVSLQLQDPQGAGELAQAVSEPASASYRQFLSPAQWEKRFSPSATSLAAVTAWLRGEGVSVEAVTPDRMTVQASAPASTVDRVFNTSLAEYPTHGRLVRLASGPLSVPSTVTGLITAVSGVDQRLMRPAALGLPGGLARSSDGQASASADAGEALAVPSSKPIEPPEWPLTPQPCSGYWGEKTDTTDPPFGDGYPDPLPYGTCGYDPSQLQSAYQLSGPIAAGDDGAGVTVAITDAYASPTLFSDVREWSKRNGSGQVLEAGQFKEDVSPTFNDTKLCGASGWSIEQTLDVESVHSMAPGANILYVGAKNCGGPLFAAVQSVVDGHLADVITDSWTGEGSEETTPTGEDRAFDNVLIMAAGTGVGVQFSAGDEGDDFKPTGGYAPQYPPESPYATGVGGTAVEISQTGQREEELSWSNSISSLCSAVVEEHEEAVEFLTEAPIECTGKLFGKWLPKAPGAYWAGGGGDTSFEYPEPTYQDGVVPKQLANRNKAITGVANRVVPDISMDADPFTGLKMGETLAEPGGATFEEFPIGGTSLASPLLAGEIADADQAAGGSLGFLNPLIYRLDANPATAAAAFYDILPPTHKQAFAIDNFVNEANSEEGLFTTIRTLGYEGKEAHCEPEGGTCVEHKLTLHAAKGYDSMTGIGSPGQQFIQELAAP